MTVSLNTSPMPDFDSKSEKKDLEQQKEPNFFLKEKFNLNSNAQLSPLETDRCNINPTGQQIEKTQQAATPVILNEAPSPIKSSTESDLKIQRALRSASQEVFGSPQSCCVVTARDQILKKFSKDQIVDDILSKHVKYYDTWINYSVKKSGLTDLYTQDQEQYGCLMAAFTHALAEQITLNRSFSDLVDLACFGRQLMASLAEKSAPYVYIFGAQRLMQKKDRRYFTPLSEGPYDGLGNALHEQKWDLSSKWIRKSDLNGATSIYYRGMDADIELSSFCFEDRVLAHTHPLDLPRAMEQTEKIFEECRILEGEALNRHLGEFFWWWCQSKPVRLGDPSIGEMLFKAVLISKGVEPPGWKENIIPWEETVREYDGKRFGENFSSLWG